MNQIKIGKFIAECRKEKGLTQLELADKLHLTDRAVSKWETGRAMPDSSIMLELCGILDITVTDLLNGERVEDNRPDITEAHLLQAIKEKQEANKKVLKVEWIVIVLAIILLVCSGVVAKYVTMPDWARHTIVAVAAVITTIAGLLCLRVEQTTGYYKCAKCGHTHVPSYVKVLFAMHMDRTRYMKCPNCGKWSWQKKTVEKKEEQTDPAE